MNIKFARDQLQKLGENPQIQFKNNQNLQVNGFMLKNTLKTSRIYQKQKRSQDNIDGKLKQYLKIYEKQDEKAQLYNKIQMKIPIFQNSSNKFQFQNAQRLRKLGIETYKRQLNSKIFSNKEVNKVQEKIINNLNGTYFKSTDRIQGKRQKMINTLGIKKNSISNYKVQWDNKQLDQAQIHWNQFGYIPNRVFPCRKNNNLQQKLLGLQKVKYIYNRKNNQKNEKSNQFGKDTKLSLKTSCNSLGKSSKILSARTTTYDKNQLSTFFSAQLKKNRSRPQTERSKRISTSSPRNRTSTNENFYSLNQSIVKYSGKRKFSENNLSSSIVFQNQKVQWSKDLNKKIQARQDFIVGKKIFIH